METLNAKFEEAYKGITAIQEKVTAHGEKLDSLDDAFIARAGEDASKALEAIGVIKAADKSKEILAEMDAMKKSMLSMQKNYSDQAPGAVNQEHKDRFSRFIRDGVTPSHEQQCESFLKSAKSTCFGLEEGDLELKANALSKSLLASGNNNVGGFLVPTDMSSTIITRVFETSPLRTVANVDTTFTNTKEYLLDDDEFGDLTSGEIQSGAQTSVAKTGIVTIGVHKIEANPRATTDFLNDAGFNVDSWLSRKLARKFARTENTQFVVGEDAQEARGFLTYDNVSAPGVYERERVEQIKSGVLGKITADSLIDLQTSLFEDYQDGSTFGMHRKTFGEVMKLTDTQGQYLLNSRVLFEGSDRILLGQPVVLMADMPVEANDSLSVVLADFSEFYTILDRSGITILRDPYTQAGKVVFKADKRTGGAVTNFQAGKILKLSA